MQRIIDAGRNAIKRAFLGAKHAEPNTGKTKRRSEPSTRHTDTDIRIEYAPCRDGDPDPGEVVWTWVPYEDDPTLGKDRPVVIIGRHGSALAGVALTSKGGRRGDRFDVGTGSWDPKRRRSYAKVDRLLDVEPGEVRREGSALDRDRFDALVKRIDERHNVVRAG